jgi:hypothetical protein
MGRRRTFAVWLVALAAMVVAMAGLGAAPVAAKSYRVTSVDIEAAVRPNGDLRVRETRVLEFSGSFSLVY